MPETLCPVHNVPMTGKDGKYGFFYSHKLDDGTWCNGKKQQFDGGQGFTRPQQPQPRQTPNLGQGEAKRSEPDWDSIAIGKVASNIINALITRGEKLTEIEAQLDAIFNLAQKICKHKPDLPF